MSKVKSHNHPFNTSTGYFPLLHYTFYFIDTTRIKQPSAGGSEKGNVDDESYLRVCNTYEGLPGVLGNKGTLAKYRREQGNISQFLGTGEQNSKNYSTKTFGKCVGNMGT